VIDPGLDGRVAIVTGANSSLGIGAAIAGGLAAQERTSGAYLRPQGMIGDQLVADERQGWFLTDWSLPRSTSHGARGETDTARPLLAGGGARMF
jgi:NAD(P)-dependent dehydrogenase (short-subunit alcohol dehydrogenase family)